MKKLFFIAFALMLSFTTAFAECRNYPKDQLAEGGGGTIVDGDGGFIVIIFKGWCGKAHVQKVFDHKPSYLELVGPQLEAKQWCDINYGGPFGLLDIYY
ncbi:MAG: hypothetical protein K6F22_03650 [Prevotella sp.]|nr:hypothetical protein [Prevotella sp.]